jgi:hypothetical protein
MAGSIPLEVTPSAYSGLIGFARRDTTPPDGIYARMWGAATQDFATGVHRPLTATALALQSEAGGRPKVLVALDIALLGDLGGASDDERVLAPVREGLSLERGELVVNCSHTHAAPWAAMSRSHNPGGELIGPYLDQLSRAILEAGREAIEALAPATLTWATGRCDLARNRDLPDPASEDGRIVCGFNPAAGADDMLVVGRVTAEGDGRVLGTIVNYACHPTTLAWDNSLISPDYVGAMREVVESHTAAPCVFLQGASGELGPAHQYVGDPAIADQHGRRLGYSALAALEGMLPPGQGLRYEGLVESGAPLAVWLPAPFEPSRTLAGGHVDVPHPVKPMPSLDELEAQHAAAVDRPIAERLFRKIQIVRNLSGGDHEVLPVWVWRVGDSLLVAHVNEAYSCFQEDLRAAFPEATVVVMNTSGAEMGYLYPPELDGLDLYQVWQTPFSKEALPTLTKACIDEGRRLFAEG